MVATDGETARRQDKQKIIIYIYIYGKKREECPNVGAVSIRSRTVLRLEQDASSTIKRLRGRQATNEYAPHPGETERGYYKQKHSISMYHMRKKRNERPNVRGVYQEQEQCSVSEEMRVQRSK